MRHSRALVKMNSAKAHLSQLLNPSKTKKRTRSNVDLDFRNISGKSDREERRGSIWRRKSSKLSKIVKREKICAKSIGCNLKGSSSMTSTKMTCSISKTQIVSLSFLISKILLKIKDKYKYSKNLKIIIFLAT